MKKQVDMGITITAAVIVAAAVSFRVYAQGMKSLPDAVCDGAFSAAILFAGIGALLLISREGMFDGLGYIGHVLVSVFTPFRSERKNYTAYREELREKHRDTGILRKGVVFLLCGAGMFLLSVILLLWF